MGAGVITDPTADKIQAIADYFKVSYGEMTDYLYIGRPFPQEKEITAETIVDDAFKHLSPEELYKIGLMFLEAAVPRKSA